MEDENYKLTVIEEESLTARQREEIEGLQKVCFSDVPQREIVEDFNAVPFARSLMYLNDQLIACAAMYKRVVDYEGKHITLGGFGGVCVREDMRHKGIGTKISKAALDVLYAQGCNIAVLAIDLSKNTDKFYSKLGFWPLNKEFSWTNNKGELKSDVGLMIAPIRSKDLFEQVLNGKSIFYIGKGYW